MGFQETVYKHKANNRIFCPIMSAIPSLHGHGVRQRTFSSRLFVEIIL